MNIFAEEDDTEEDGSAKAAVKLFHFGRPLWGSRCHPDSVPKDLARELISLASWKTDGDSLAKALALISYRLEFYLTSSHLADEMVSNCFRQVAFINKEKDLMRAVQPSEPILAYTAASKMINPEVRLKALREFMLSCFEGSLMSTGNVGEMVASIILLFAHDEKQFDDPTALPKPILLHDYLESLFGSERCDEMAQRMRTDADMKKLWETGMVYFNHFVNLKNPPALETLDRAFSRAAAFFLPKGFPGADIIIPVEIPGVVEMTFCTIQVKNRKHDAFTAKVKTIAMADLKKAADKLEWSQNHIAIMMCLRHDTTSEEFGILLPEKLHSQGTRNASKARKARADDNGETWNWSDKKKRLLVLALGVEESVYKSIDLCGGEQLADSSKVSSLLTKLLGCVLGTSFPDEAEDDHVDCFAPLG